MSDKDKTKKELLEENKCLRGELSKGAASGDGEKRLRKLAELSLMLSGDPVEVFNHIARMIAELVGVPTVCLSEVRGDELYFLSVFSLGKVVSEAGHCDLAITPCATVEESKDMRVYERVAEKFPEASFLKDANAYSYCGFPALDSEGKVVAVTCLLDDKPHDFSEEDKSLLNILAQRIGVEMERKGKMAEQKKAEEELKNEKDYLEKLHNAIGEAVFTVKMPERIIESVNSSVERIFGYLPQECVGEITEKFYPEGGSLEYGVKMKAAIGRGDELIRTEQRLRRKDGEEFSAGITTTFIREEGEVVRVISIVRDRTERKRAEGVLKQNLDLLDSVSRAQSRFISEVEPLVVFDELLTDLFDITGSEYGFIGQVLYADDGEPYLKSFATTDISWSKESKDFYEANAPEGLEFLNMKTLYGAVITTGEPVISNDPASDPRAAGIPEGHPPLNAFLGLPFYKGEKLVGMMGLANREGGYDREMVDFLNPFAVTCANMIEGYRNEERRIKAEEELRDSEERYKQLINNVDLGITLVDKDYNIIMANRHQGEMFSKPPSSFIGLKCFNEYIKREDICENCPGARAMESGRPEEVDTEGVLEDGTSFSMHIKTFPVFDSEGNATGFIEVIEDVTERQRMESEQRKVQKLESVGVLAGGIAHDFNNLLTGIMGNITLAMHAVDAEDPVHKRLVEAEKASLFARELTGQLLTFAKGGAPVKEPLSIGDILSEAASFALRGSNASCKYSIPGTLPGVEADRGQINQVINNMIINANQAMPEGGIVSLSAEVVTIDSDSTLPVDDGECVKITIEDHGSGIPPEHLSKIFDPYFTTKQKGSGLGLATAYSIIKKHKGVITVESKHGEGTTFSIYLPASEKAVEKFEGDETLHLGSGRVLVMDDEEIIRDLLAELLKKLGYEFETAPDGAAAIELFGAAKGSAAPFDFVIMDLTVPGGMGGREAIGELLKMDPAIKVVVSSGYANDPIMADYKKYGFSGVVAKPYTAAALSKVLKEVSGQG